MDISLFREIYGTPWLIDPISFVKYKALLDSARNGVEISSEKKLNSFGLMESNVQGAPRLARDIDRDKQIPQNSIALYNFDSVITKYGGYSHYGTKEMGDFFSRMEKEDNVIGHLFYVESGGGSANAIKYIRDFSAKSERNKPLVVYAEDIMASAAMYIASDADYIIANREDAMIGSIGTMIEFEGYEAGTKDTSGKKHIRVYATQSVNKNKEFEDAINNDNYELIRSQILDPHAEEFIKDMTANRPNIRDIEKTGAIFKAREVVGTLIDGIGTYEDAVNKLYELTSYNKNEQIEIMSESAKFTQEQVDQFKVEAKNSGIEQERKRVRTWLVYKDVDPEAVSKGIKDGTEIDMEVMAEMSMKKQVSDRKESHETDSADDLDTNDTARTKEEIDQEAEMKHIDSLVSDIKIK